MKPASPGLIRRLHFFVQAADDISLALISVFSFQYAVGLLLSFTSILPLPYVQEVNSLTHSTFSYDASRRHFSA